MFHVLILGTYRFYFKIDSQNGFPKCNALFYPNRTDVAHIYEWNATGKVPRGTAAVREALEDGKAAGIPGFRLDGSSRLRQTGTVRFLSERKLFSKAVLEERLAEGALVGGATVRETRWS